MSTKLGWRKWLTFILAGFVGQLAWSIENNYLNVYVFDVTARYDFIPVMTLQALQHHHYDTIYGCFK